VPIRIEEIRDRLPDAVRALDQPSIDGPNTYFVSEAAAKAGLKVAVSGVGGDELFGGYDSFARVPRVMRHHARLTNVPGLALAARGVESLLPRTRVGIEARKALTFGGDIAGAYYVERGSVLAARGAAAAGARARRGRGRGRAARRTAQPARSSTRCRRTSTSARSRCASTCRCSSCATPTR
jgi:asparagine synthetase B (glutamine-hydrolysing)